MEKPGNTKYKIVLSKKAQKTFHLLDKNMQLRIREALFSYIDYIEGKTNKCPDVKALRGNFQGYYRLRVGKYRVIFEQKVFELVIHVLDIIQRGDAYKRR